MRMRRSGRLSPAAQLAAIAGLALLTGLATLNWRTTRATERSYPPRGRLLWADGVSLHIVEEGEGFPLVMLHGNGSIIEDFRVSGLIAAAAKTFRVVAIDRPGFGYSERPRDRIWTAARQADLVHAALQRLGVDRCIVLGHSWGALVALECAIRHPREVAGLVLASGFFFPTPRIDAALAGLPALPGVGTIARHAVLPLAGIAIWRTLMKRIFWPAQPSRRLDGEVRAMALRPSQLRAAAAESWLMFLAAFRVSRHLSELELPVGIIAGAGDRHVPPRNHSERLHRRLRNSFLHLVPGAGHMVHQTAPDAVMEMIDKVAVAAATARQERDRAEPTAHQA